MPWDSCLEGGAAGVATLACVPIVLKNLINAALVLAGIVALVMFMYGGAKYIMSRGDQAKLDEAKKTLTWAVVGLFIIFFSFAIVGLIAKLTGVDQIAHPTL